MDIKDIIFQIITTNAHNWVRYWVNEELSGVTLPGEYIEIKSNYLSRKPIQLLLDAGFKIEVINPKVQNQDAYCEVLFKRELSK
jgi:hypothetical protein